MTAALRSPYSWLLAGLVAVALLVPFVERGPTGAVLVNELSTALIAAAVAAVAKKRIQLVVALTLALPAVVWNGVELLSDGAVSGPVRALQTAFFAYTTCVILVEVVREERVTAEKIRGAVCVFLLIGGTWAFAYLTLLVIDPGALAFQGTAGGAVENAGVHWVGDVLYFSFVTLTTTGYGDILPMSPVARSMATLEATIGQMYLAILVARLVGLHIVHGQRPA